MNTVPENQQYATPVSITVRELITQLLDRDMDATVKVSTFGSDPVNVRTIEDDDDAIVLTADTE